MKSRTFLPARRTLLMLFAMLALTLVATGCGASKSDSDKDSTPAASSDDTSTETTAETETDTEEPPDAGEPSEQQWDAPPPMTINKAGKYTAVVKTSKGDFTIQVLPAQGPIAANNFVFLAKQGFYTNVPVHRIVTGFMIQTGDPTGTGSGGPGYSIKDDPVKIPYSRGVVAMANAGPDTGGSQFFVMHQDYNLPPNYSIFGKVIKGIETIDAIADTPVEDNGGGELSAPTEDVTIKSITVTGG